MIEYIKKTVCDYLDFDIQLIDSKSHKPEIVFPRQIIHYLCRDILPNNKYSLKLIGENVGSKDHATVLASCKSVQNRIDTEPLIKELIEALKDVINNRIPEKQAFVLKLISKYSVKSLKYWDYSNVVDDLKRVLNVL